MSLAGEVVVFTGKLSAFPRRQAELAAKASGAEIARSVTRRTTMLVVGQEGWPILPDGSVSSKVVAAEKLGATLVPEAEFLVRVGMHPPTPQQGHYSPEELAATTGGSVAELNRWKMWGLIRATEGRYDFQDLVTARRIAQLVDGGATAERIAKSMAVLAKWLPDFERPLAQLRIIVEHRDELAVLIDGVKTAPSGQTLLAFPPHEDDAHESQLSGQSVSEERHEVMQDAELLREALVDEPENLQAGFDLGNALRELGNLEEAAEQFRAIVDGDRGYSEAWYNLADVLDEQGQFEDAIGALERCIEVAPDYADAHFNLASLLERAGHLARAASHWERYMALDVDSEWATIARKHLRLINQERRTDKTDSG